MHAHDRSLITGGFDVRFAEPGGDGRHPRRRRAPLDPADVLIVDDVATAAIGGVMGAGTTEVRDSTTDVLLEAAVWDPAAVSRTQRRLHLDSEAGRRYERTVDPAISVAALDRCAALLADIAGGTVEPTLTDWRGDPPRDDWSPPAGEHARRPARPHRRCRSTRTAPRERRLTQIGAGSRRPTDRVTATPPSWRPDLEQPADLVEEVLRLEGLDVIPSVLPLAPARPRPHTRPEASPGDRKVVGAQRLRRDPADPVPAGRGLRPVGAARRRSAAHHQGCSTRWSPIGRSSPPRCCPGCWRRWRATSPAAPSTSRCSPSRRSSQATPQTRAVERIPIDRRPTDDEIAVLDESLPRQPQHVAAVLTGLREPAGPWGPGRPVEAADAFEAVRIIGRAGDVEFTLRAAQHLPWHPGRCAEVLIGDAVVGYAGQLHPAVIERSGLPKGTCAVELDLDAIPIVETLPAPAVSPFPAVFQDVSLVVADDVAAQPSSTRSATVPANCSRTSGCSTSTPARRSARAASR